MAITWTVFKNGMVLWLANVPCVNKDGEDIAFDYLGEYLDLLDAYKINRNFRTGDGYDETNRESYIEFLKEKHRNNDWFCPFYRNKGSTLICYEESGHLVEAMVSDMGQLAMEIGYPPEGDEIPLFYRPPLEIFGQPIPQDKRWEDAVIGVGVLLYTDIWLPWVANPYDYGFSERRGLKGLTDNRAIANRHTPRLNAFLGVAKDLSLRYGGEFRLEIGGGYKVYDAMYTDSSIRLDIEP